MPAKSKAQQRFMGMVHAAQKGELDNPSSEVEKAADSMSDADAKDYASTKHKGLPNHVKKENMEKELKEIIRQTYRESLRESINEAKYPTDLKVGSVILGQGFTRLKGVEGGKYYKIVDMDDTTATLVPSDKGGNVKGSSKVRHKLDSIEGGIKTAKRGDENGIVVIKESVNETVSHEAMGIASMTNTRKEAVQKFIDDNNLNAKEILNHVTKGKLPERIRFVQALVGTPNNSSFKWYVKTYANESVNESIDINHWKKYANGGGPLFSRKVKTQREFNTEFREVAYGYNNDPDSRENKLKRDKIEKVKKLAQEFFDKEGFITSNIIDEMWSAMVSGKIKEGKVNEGKKAFKINPPIGSSKYSISAYDGITKHKDGSPFWNILIFKNKADLERRANYFRSEKYIEEAVNESVIKEDVYKTILSNDKGKMFFGLVDDETRDVKFLDAVTWIKSTIKDKASDSSKELVLAALVRQINQFNRKVEYNMWVNANKPTWEEKIKHLLDKRLVNNVNRGGIKVH